jgi:tetratricopeptide (TPR) repeat protein
MSTPESHRRLAVAVVVRDAADALRETLDSVRAIADEVVVVDSGSSDETRNVARAFGARVRERVWSDDFSAARNAALRDVTSEWVLWLDAGESLSAEDATELRNFVATSADPGRGYLLLVTLPPDGFHAATEQIARPRLVPVRRGLEFRGRVREVLTDLAAGQPPVLEGLPYQVRRGQREHDPRAKVAKARRNIRLAKMEIQQSGGQARLFNCVGDALQTLGDNQRAAEAFRRGLELSSPGSSEMLEAYYGVITSLDGVDGAHEKQLSIAVKALEAFPLDAQLLCAMGGYLQAQGRIDLALQAYRTAYQYGQVNPSVWHVAEIRDIAAICCSLILQMQHQGEDARRMLQEALAENPSSARLRRQLIELHVRAGIVEQALEETSRLPEDFPQIEAFRSAIRGACLAAQGNWLAAKTYLTAAHQAGCTDPLCLRWLATALMVSGSVDAARPIVQQWLQVDPKNPEALRYRELLQLPPDHSLGDGRHVRLDEAQPHISKSVPPAPTNHGLPHARPSDSRPHARP